MNINQAKRRMATIEKSIKAMKDAGYNVYCVDNELLVLESPKTVQRNTKTFEKASVIDRRKTMVDGGYKAGFQDSINQAGGLKYDYEISLT